MEQSDSKCSLPLKLREGCGSISCVEIVEKRPGVTLLQTDGLRRLADILALLNQITNLSKHFAKILLLRRQRVGPRHAGRTMSGNRPRRLYLA